MELDGDVLHIDIGIEMDEIVEFEQFVRPRLEYIEQIEVNTNEGHLASSALLALLVSIRRSNPSINIPFLDNQILTSPFHGTLHWTCHD